jgi:hypothetical protein
MIDITVFIVISIEQFKNEKDLLIKNAKMTF